MLYKIPYLHHAYVVISHALYVESSIKSDPKIAVNYDIWHYSTAYNAVDSKPPLLKLIVKIKLNQQLFFIIIAIITIKSALTAKES